LARFANGILVVVRSGTKVRLLERLEQRLAVLPAPLVGYVFTRGRSELQDARSTPQAQVRLAVE
jgi:hypothetical protein